MKKSIHARKLFEAHGGFGFGAFARALPLPRQNNLLNLAFPAPKSPKGTLILVPQFYAYILNNQKDTKNIWGAKGQFLSHKTTSTDFEFNRPILKKGAPILKDFEKNSTDFERFATFLSTARRQIFAVGNFRINHISVLLPNYCAFLSSRDFSGQVTPNSQHYSSLFS